jgi:hypothetical protein
MSNTPSTARAPSDLHLPPEIEARIRVWIAEQEREMTFSDAVLHLLDHGLGADRRTAKAIPVSDLDASNDR